MDTTRRPLNKRNGTKNTGGRRVNRNTKPCPKGGPGYGRGGGRGGGKNR